MIMKGKDELILLRDLGMPSRPCVRMTELEMNVIGLRVKFIRTQMSFILISSSPHCIKAL